MNKEFIEKAEKQIGRKLSYKIRCDDKTKPKEIESDMYFELWDTERLDKTLELCEKYDLRYDLVLESFDPISDSIEDEFYIVSSNYKNQQ